MVLLNVLSIKITKTIIAEKMGGEFSYSIKNKHTECNKNKHTECKKNKNKEFWRKTKFLHILGVVLAEQFLHTEKNQKKKNMANP